MPCRAGYDERYLRVNSQCCMHVSPLFIPLPCTHKCSCASVRPARNCALSLHLHNTLQYCAWAHRGTSRSSSVTTCFLQILMLSGRAAAQVAAGIKTGERDTILDDPFYYQPRGAEGGGFVRIRPLDNLVRRAWRDHVNCLRWCVVTGSWWSRREPAVRCARAYGPRVLVL